MKRFRVFRTCKSLEKAPCATMGAMAELAVTALPASPSVRREPEALEFPGCRAVRISREEIADYEGRIEYWDADTEVAMVCEPTTIYHEHPSQRLAALATTIGHARGSPIRALGASDLLVHDAGGAWRRILQADQTLYLHPRRAPPRGPAIEVGTDALPDVVLEVDHTTDVRRGKLGLYESWGFPEVWVEVPDEGAPSRPASLRPGLTIYLLGREGFHTAPGSRSFPGWTAEEIHRAMNELTPSRETTAVLRRVGRALGAAEGTGPDDDPFLRAERREIHAEGRVEGHAEGWIEGLHAAIARVLEAQGIHVSSRRLAEIEDVSDEALVDAALACRDEEDFMRLARR